MAIEEEAIQKACTNFWEAFTQRVLSTEKTEDRKEKLICSIVIRPASTEERWRKGTDSALSPDRSSSRDRKNERLLFEMSRISSMIVSSELASVDTIIKFSRCCLVSSLSSVRIVIPICAETGVTQMQPTYAGGDGRKEKRTMPFIGVRISSAKKGRPVRFNEQRRERKGARTTHVCKELGFRPIGKFCRDTGGVVALDALPQLRDHGVDLESDSKQPQLVRSRP
jgi:hypothetical protein